MLLTILATVGWHLATQLFWYKHPVEQKLLEMVRLILMMIVIIMTMLRTNYDDDYYDHDHFISPLNCSGAEQNNCDNCTFIKIIIIKIF